MHRVRKPNLKKGAPAVFMQHGLMDSSNTFISNGMESNGLKFANAGYDVWLGNNRGN
jgi:pimeloyl-ACP methyl ester carboxylesterase